MGAGAMALEGEKVSPKVDLCLSLAFQMERILSFSSIRSASGIKILQQVKTGPP